MNETFYGSPEYNYLKHHGILGMKWGKKNGPPYPLGDAKHDKIIARAEKKAAREKAREEKRKKKIAKDPAKLKKYNEKFTDEEIDAALKRIDRVKEIDKRIPDNTKLSTSKKMMSRTPERLNRNMDKFSEGELKTAVNRLRTREDLFKLAVDRKSRKTAELKARTDKINGITNFINAALNLKEKAQSMKSNNFTAFKKANSNMGLNDSDMYKYYLKKQLSEVDKKINAKDEARSKAEFVDFVKDNDINLTDDEINKAFKKLWNA